MNARDKIFSLSLCGAVSVWAGLVDVAAAQDAETGRYSAQPGGDGSFVRVDTRSGETSFCTSSDGTWSCTPIPEAEKRVDGEVPGDDVEVLRQRIEALEAALADGNDLTADALAATVDHLGRLESRLADVAAAVARGDRVADDTIAAVAVRVAGLEQAVADLAAASASGRANVATVAELADRIDALERGVAASGMAATRAETAARDDPAARYDKLEQRLAALEAAMPGREGTASVPGSAARDPGSGVLARDLAALDTRVESIGERVAALEAALAEGQAPEAGIDTEPSEDEGFAVRVIDRFVSMVRRLREANAGPSLRPSL